MTLSNHWHHLNGLAAPTWIDRETMYCICSSYKHWLMKQRYEQ
uniref:Uncharacterized protein n=1 Tax=Rhizophora mucronata TaxID=61149 RepID=A0A2P2N174_RHIMU